MRLQELLSERRPDEDQKLDLIQIAFAEYEEMDVAKTLSLNPNIALARSPPWEDPTDQPILATRLIVAREPVS